MGSFFLFSSIFYVLVLYIIGSYAPSIHKLNINYPIGAPGHMHSRISEIKKYGSIDILFLGSSHTYRGFDTRIFLENGYKSFNLGSSSQTPIQTKVLLNRYLETLKPHLVIYEVYPATFAADGVESSLDIIANDINDIHSLNMALKINNIKTYNTLIYGFTRNLFGLDNSFSEPLIKGIDKYVSGGFVEREIGFYKPSEFEIAEIYLRDYQFTSFVEIIQLIKKQNIELILVYAPIPKVNYNRYSNNQYFDSTMMSYSKYYNFNELNILEDSLHFYDSHHLNQYGVEIFNKKLIELLKVTKSSR